MSIVLIILLSCVLLFAFIGTPRDASGTRPALSAYTVILTLFAVYAVVPAALIVANGSKYIWAPTFADGPALPATLGVCLAAVLAFLLGHFVFSRRSLQRLSPIPSRVSAPSAANVYGARAAVATVAVGLSLKLYFVLSSGGLGQTVQRLSSSVRENSGLEELDTTVLLLRNASGIADGAAVWLLLSALKSKRHRSAAAILLIVVLLLSYTTMGKRLGLLWPLLAVAVGLHVYVRRIGLRALPIGVLAFLALTMGTLMFRIFLPAASAGVGIDLNQIAYSGGSVFAFYFYSLEFSTVEMMTVAIFGRDDINNLFGGTLEAFWETSILPFSYIIPRTIWPDKPEVLLDLSHGISAVSTGTPLQNIVGFASTLVGTSYISAGVIGTIIAFLLLGFFTASVDRRILDEDWSVVSVLRYSFLLVLAFHLFRQGTMGWVFIIAVVLQLGFLVGMILPVLASKHTPTAPNHRRIPVQGTTVEQTK